MISNNIWIYIKEEWKVSSGMSVIRLKSSSLVPRQQENYTVLVDILILRCFNPCFSAFVALFIDFSDGVEPSCSYGPLHLGTRLRMSAFKQLTLNSAPYISTPIISNCPEIPSKQIRFRGDSSWFSLQI